MSAAEATLRVGEVIESATTGFTAVSSTVFEPPAFGTFVSAGPSVIGLVHEVTHVPADPNRRATPLGMEWEELIREHPQISDLIRTEFRALTVAHIDQSGRARPWLPATPARIHDFVRVCPPETVASLCGDAAFIRLLASASTPVLPDLVAAAVRNASGTADDPKQFILDAGRRVAEAWRDDYPTATLILDRLSMEFDA